MNFFQRSPASGRPIALLALLAAAAAYGQPAGKPEQPYVSRPDTVDPRLRRAAAGGAPLAVAIVLSEQPQAEIYRRHAEAAAGELEESVNRLRSLLANGGTPAEIAAVRANIERILLQVRRNAAAEISAAIAPSQAAAVARVQQAGGQIKRRFDALNLFTADLPPAALDQVAADPLVAEIRPADRHFLQLSVSVPALGAPAFWDSGFLGAGQSVAVLDTGVPSTHPAFAGLTINSQVFLNIGSQDPCFGDNASSGEDLQGHGSHVAGIVASRGSSECLMCRGVARGLGTLYNLKIGFLIKNAPNCDGAGGGAAISSDVVSAITWLAQNTSTRIVNYSYGGDVSGDDDAPAREMDQLAEIYGLLPVVAAGNSGPGAKTVLSPGIAYNILSVANWSSRGTIASSSSRGPTANGRRKPDLAAPGSSILSLAQNWASPGVSDYIYRSGTSMATPHIAGAAALLMDAGVLDSLAVKAILINTTDDVDWAADRGWGYTNLTTARNALFYRTGGLKPRPAAGFYKLYKVRTTKPLRSTITWNRHIVNGSTSVFHDVDIVAYGLSSNTVQSQGGSSINNVEQVSVTAAGDYVVKARMFSTTFGGGVTTEPFAVAFSEGDITDVNGPQLSITCAPASGNPLPSSSFTLNCTASNNGDLPAFGVSGSVTLASGFTGPTALTYGTLQPNSTGLATLTLTAPNATGTYNFSAALSSTSYEETFTGSGNFTVSVNPQLPGAPSNPSPAANATGVSGTPALSWTAGSSATSYDVYFGTSASPPFVGNTAALTFSPGTLTGETTYYWRAVAKNASGSTTSPVWSFTTQIILTAPASPSPAAGATGITVAPQLSWSPAGTGVTYDIYFGTGGSPGLVASIGTTSFSPGTLAGGTTYTWRVVAKKGAATVNSATWTFTTVPKALGLNPPSLLPVTPSTVTGSPQVFTVTARDFDGFDNISKVYFVVNSSPSVPQNVCHGYYDRVLNAIYLYNDAVSVLQGPLAPGAAATLENSQCAVEGVGSALYAASGPDLTVLLKLRLKGAFAGTSQKLFLWVTDAQGNGTGWQQAAVWNTSNLNQPPSILNTSPANPQGSSQTFTLTARDPDGYDNLSRIYFLINSSTAIPQNVCHGYYDRAANVWLLYNDALSALQGPLVPGTSATLQNSQCAIDGLTTALFAYGGTDVTLKMGVSLKGGFAVSTQKVYYWAVDNDGNGTGWVQAALWGVPNLNRAPELVSASPASVIGSPKAFTFALRDADGAGNLHRMYFLANPDTSIPANTCHGFYDRALNALYLYNDGLTALMGPLTPGAAGTLQNSQCTIDGPSSALVSIAGTDLTLKMGMSLRGTFATTTQKVSVWVTDMDGNGTGWLQASLWAANSAAFQPSLGTVSPAVPTGSPQAITVTGRSPLGAANISRIYFLIDNQPSVPANSCHGFYDRAANAMYLYNDALSLLMGPLTPGASGSVENSQCGLDAPLSALVSASGTDLTVKFGMRLKGTFAASARTMYFWVQDNQGNGTGWVNGGTWWPAALSSQPPVVVSGSPSTPSGSPQTFRFTLRDPNGSADIYRVYFLVNSNTAIPVNTCHGFYDRAANAVYLYNDTLSALLGPLTPGTAGSLANSQCSISGPGSAAALSGGTDLVLDLGVSQSGAAAASTQKVYVWVRDNAGNDTGWVQTSTWAP